MFRKPEQESQDFVITQWIHYCLLPQKICEERRPFPTHSTTDNILAFRFDFTLESNWQTYLRWSLDICVKADKTEFKFSKESP